jgi:hypothetical protein
VPSNVSTKKLILAMLSCGYVSLADVLFTYLVFVHKTPAWSFCFLVSAPATFAVCVVLYKFITIWLDNQPQGD